MTEEQFAILKSGVDRWNLWRKNNPGPLCIAISSERDRAYRFNTAIFGGLSLRGVNFHNIDLRGASFHGADLREANLSHADLHEVDLSGADLRKANLFRANAEFVNLESANLSEAILEQATIHYSRLFRAKLAGAVLYGANLQVADLRDVTLHCARLNGTDFWAANLDGADFGYAVLGQTRLINVDLSAAKRLELTTHDGPSTIGIDTIYKSRARIPETFLRGCGVPEGFITQAHSLIGAEDGIQFYSCFISYSSKDEEFARRLHGRMRDAHLRVWFAPEDIQGGKKLHEQIEAAIRVYDKLLVVLSDASLQSEWVTTELRNARKAERQSGTRKLFPVRLVNFETLRDWQCFDADSGKDLAVELREYFIPDFSNWKHHDSFEIGFERLLKDLRSKSKAA